jgi:hypothetical protein
MFDIFTLVSVSLRHTQNETKSAAGVETFVWHKDTFRLWKISNMQRFNVHPPHRDAHLPLRDALRKQRPARRKGRTHSRTSLDWLHGAY